MKNRLNIRGLCADRTLQDIILQYDIPYFLAHKLPIYITHCHELGLVFYDAIDDEYDLNLEAVLSVGEALKFNQYLERKCAVPGGCQTVFWTAWKEGWLG